MPFVKRAVEPVILSRRKVGEDKFDFGAVSNNTLVGVLLQLGSLVQHADELFQELTQDCQEVIYRTQRLRNRVVNITDKVENLNARVVKVRKYIDSILFVSWPGSTLPVNESTTVETTVKFWTSSGSGGGGGGVPVQDLAPLAFNI